MTKQGRVLKEKKIVQFMIEIYCYKKHGQRKNELCDDCKELLDYAHKRLTYCKFGDKKTSCSKCPIHCYKKDMKEKIKEVMRFSGPRLIIYKPYEFIRHIFK